MSEEAELQKNGVEDNLSVGAKGGAIAFLLKMGATLFGFLNQILLARMLGAGGLGEVLLAISVARTAASLAKFGFEETMMRFVAEFVENKDSSRLKGVIFFSIKFSFLLSVILAALVWIFSELIALGIFHSENVMKLLPIVAVSIPATVIREVTGGILKGYKDTRKALIPESVIAPVIKIGLFLLLMLQGISPLYAVVAYIAGEIAAALFSVSYLRKRIKLLGNVLPKCDRKHILSVAYTIIFTGMTVLLYTQADLWILGVYRSTEIVGIYGVAARIVILIYFPMMAFATIIPPLISSVHAAGDHKELRKIVMESTRWILSIAMPVVLVFMLEGRLILKILYGANFEAGYIVLLILCVAQLIKAASGLVGTILQMTGEHKVYMKINIVMGVLNVLLNLLLVPSYGMLGAAVASAICLALVDITGVIVIYKRLSIISLARGIWFDIVFISLVIAVYFATVTWWNDTAVHLVLFVSLFAYIYKSIVAHDIPWKLLLNGLKKRS